MYDRYNRHIHYLRISVTDRCNLRCSYCMPADGIRLVPHEEILSFDEIVDVVKVAVSLGVNKIRLTGGEPLVRAGIVDLVRKLSSIEGIPDLSLTTNGILLAKYAAALKQAGLKRVNISLDTIDSNRYKEITRGGNIDDVFRGIAAAREAGLEPIKINCVRFSSSGDEESRGVKDYCEKEGLQVRFIHQMNLETGEFSEVEGGEGGVCHKCNRLRMTSTGMIKPVFSTSRNFRFADQVPGRLC
ncbi:MAG: radical SAM protein [Bacteroidales bacterium]